MNINDVLWMVIFPLFLTLIQLLVSTRTKQIYLWLGFFVLCSFSIGVYLYLTQSTTFSVVLISVSVSIPILFSLSRYILAPLWHRYQKLKQLPKILGAIDWGLNRSQNIDTYKALDSVQSAFNFMGFGFKKYLLATPDNKVVSNRSHLGDSLLWKKLKEMIFLAPKQKIKILIMNPLAFEIEKYSKHLKEKFPKADVEEDLYFSLECLKELQREFGKIINVRFYPNSLTYKPSFRMFFSNNDDLHVSFYQWGTMGTDLPYIHLKKNDRAFFHAFHTLFDYLWEHGETADIENMSISIDLQDIYTHHSYSIERVRKYIQYQLPEHLKNVPLENLRIAVAAIAGRSSALAILKSAESGEYDCIVPVLVGTPAKYIDKQNVPSALRDLGDFEVRGDTIKKLKQAIEETKADNSCFLLNTIFINPDTRLWVDLFRNVQTQRQFETGHSDIDRVLNSPCIPCHIYIYYVRAMLCQRLGIKKMIGGDRVFHDNTIKVNQIDIVLDTIGEIVRKDFDVEFITPLEKLKDNREILKKLDFHGLNNVFDVSCIFDGQGAIPSNGPLDKDTVTLINQKIKDDIIPTLQKLLYSVYGNTIPQPKSSND